MTNVKRFLTAWLTAGVLSVASAYTESDNSGNKTLAGAENVGTIDAVGVTISGGCSSWMDKDYYKIVTGASTLTWEVDRTGAYGYDPNRSTIKLLDASGQFVDAILSQGDPTSSGSCSVLAGQTYYIYAYATSSSDDSGNGQQKYEIVLKCSGGSPDVKTLTSLSISGSSTVTSGSGESYTCTAYYSDGSHPTVSPTWTIESGKSYASVNSSGWLSASTVTSPQPVTLKASYGGKSTTKAITIKPKENDNVLVTFNGNGGTVYNLAGQAVGSSIQLAQTPGTKWRNLPDATNGSKTFDGWWTQPSGGTRITTSDTFSGTPTTVYAHWKTPVTPTLSISPTTGDDVDWGGGAGWFSVTCNSSWSVSTSDAWITLNTRSGSNNGTVYFSYDDNDSSSSRLGKITVTCGSLTRTYQFTQQRHFKKGPGGLDYFACTDGDCDLGARNLPFIAAGTHVVYGVGVDEIRFVPKTSGWQTIWLRSKPLPQTSGCLSAWLHDGLGESLADFDECGKATVYLEARREYSLQFGASHYSATRPQSGESYEFELQVGGSAPQIAYLDAPTILSVSASEICWSKVPEATEYRIYRYPKAWSEKTGAPHYGDCIATVLASEGTCCRITPVPGDRFYVRAVNSKVTSWFSEGYGYNPPTYEIRFEDRGDILPMKTGRLAVINIPLMSACVCEVGKVYALPACTFTPPSGKHFAGWACSNGRRYDDGMLVFDLAEPGETVTMTAIWEDL